MDNTFSNVKMNIHPDPAGVNTFPGNNIFEYFFSRGPLYPATPEGRPLCKIKPGLEIRDMAALLKLQRRGIRRFIFRPADLGLVGIDLDKKNGKDGISEFITRTGLDPCVGFYVTTPSCGLHLYFTTGQRDIISREIWPGVEVKSRAFITAPGSVSDRGRYIPHGNPKDFIPLPADLAEQIIVKREHRMQSTTYVPDRPGTLSLDRIAEIIERQGITPVAGSRNVYAFQFSRFARRKGHDLDAVVQWLANRLAASDFGPHEIRASASSAYRHDGRSWE